MVDVVAFTTALSALAYLLATGRQPVAVMEGTAESVSRVLALTGAGVCLAERNRLRAVAATTTSTGELERCQEELQQGPCRDCYDTGQVVTITDIRVLSSRWPWYVGKARELRLAAVASVPMGPDTQRVGVLDLYDTEPRIWSDDDLSIAAAFADIAAGFLINTSNLAQQQQLNQHLERALQTRIVIEQAKGMIADRHGISPDQAFDLIRRYARSHRISLAEISRRIVEKGMRPTAEVEPPRQR